MKARYLPLVALLCLFGPKLFAQDPGYSLTFANPMTIMPSLAGLTEGTGRFGLSHRMKAATAQDNFQTTVASGDVTLNYPFLRGGVGLLLVNDIIGKYRSTEIHAAFAYEVPLGVKVRYSHLRAGFQVGLINRAIGDNFTWEDQFQNTGFTQGTSEKINNLSVFVPDVAISLVWYRTQKIKGNPEFNYYLGAAVGHITQPRIKFLTGETYRTSMKYTALAGGRVRTRTPFDMNINALFTYQNNFWQITASLYGRYVFYEKNRWFGKESASISFGGHYRYNESVSIFVGTEIKRKLSIAFAYDIVASTNAIVNPRFGGLQAMFSYQFIPKNYRINALPFPRF
jgi:type IX secretion system PorP/SprF family membrane protein